MTESSWIKGSPDEAHFSRHCLASAASSPPRRLTTLFGFLHPVNRSWRQSGALIFRNQNVGNVIRTPNDPRIYDRSISLNTQVSLGTYGCSRSVWFTKRVKLSQPAVIATGFFVDACNLVCGNRVPDMFYNVEFSCIAVQTLVNIKGLFLPSIQEVWMKTQQTCLLPFCVEAGVL
jgi:hypothetical protein